MKLKPGYEHEYKRRHDEIWPELQDLLKEVGIIDYSIFLDQETGILFAFQKLIDSSSTELLPGHPIVKKWWRHMRDIMDTNPDNSPVVQSLEEVFHLG
ncbi:UNVERIFIED_CONTAM: hypothetical protein GTU68_041227 [Idotea baltica]|nr:hypothetical protein [Idotea baltica]